MRRFKVQVSKLMPARLKRNTKAGARKNVLLPFVFASLVLGGLIATDLTRTVWHQLSLSAESIHYRYGIDLPVVLIMFAFAEILFCGSIALMLRHAGRRITWESIRSFQLRELDLDGRKMMGLLWLNRLAWIIPWGGVLVMSFGRVPLPATLAAIAEIVATVGLGILMSLGLGLPWWNREKKRNRQRRPSDHTARIKLATVEDVPALMKLEQEVWGTGAACRLQLEQRIRNVPRGNIMAVAPDGRICGFTSFCLLDYDGYESRGLCSWNSLSGAGTASTHVPGAPDLFGINLGVANWAPKGTSTRLLAEVAREGLRAGARRAVLGSRMPGYHKHSDRLSAEEYLKTERKPGVPLDPELRFYYKVGMRPIRLVPNYYDDSASLNWGVIVEKRVPWIISAAGPIIARLPIDRINVLEKI